jgi:hypothetical protein
LNIISEQYNVFNGDIVECLMAKKEKNAIGIRSINEDVKVRVKPNSRKYLKARKQMIYKLVLHIL